jgi:hypothetical protein
VRNEKSEPRDLELRLEAAADFADLFEVKDALSKKGETYQRVEDGRLVLGYRRETFVRENWVTSSAPSVLDPEGMTFHVHLEPHGEWQATIDVWVPDALKATPAEANAGEPGGPAADAAPAKALEGWLASGPNPPGSRWPSWRRRPTSTCARPRPSRGIGAISPAFPSSIRPRAARRPGRAALRCSCFAPCSGSSPSARTSWSTRHCEQIGWLEILDIPGRWQRTDAFGRGLGARG